MGIDLYDREIAAATQLMMRLNERGKGTRNTAQELRDFGMRIQDEFYKIGLVVNVDLTKCAMINVKTGRTYPPEVEVIARVNDHTNTGEFDHDEKRHEVLKSRELGQKYLGVPRNARI